MELFPSPNPMLTAEQLRQRNLIRPQVSGFGVGRFYQYKSERFWTVAPSLADAVERANKLLQV